MQGSPAILDHAIVLSYRPRGKERFKTVANGGAFGVVDGHEYELCWSQQAIMSMCIGHSGTNQAGVQHRDLPMLCKAVAQWDPSVRSRPPALFTVSLSNTQTILFRGIGAKTQLCDTALTRIQFPA